jgi:hypothetical protein
MTGYVTAYAKESQTQDGSAAFARVKVQALLYMGKGPSSNDELSTNDIITRAKKCMAP